MHAVGARHRLPLRPMLHLCSPQLALLFISSSFGSAALALGLVAKEEAQQDAQFWSRSPGLSGATARGATLLRKAVVMNTVMSTVMQHMVTWCDFTCFWGLRR